MDRYALLRTDKGGAYFVSEVEIADLTLREIEMCRRNIHPDAKILLLKEVSKTEYDNNKRACERDRQRAI